MSRNNNEMMKKWPNKYCKSPLNCCINKVIQEIIMECDIIFDSQEDISSYDFTNKFTYKKCKPLCKIRKNRSLLAKKRYTEKIPFILLVLIFLNCFLFANEQNSLLTDEDKIVLKSDNDEKIIEYLKESIYPYQTDIQQRTSKNRQRFIELNTFASKSQSMDVKITAYTYLSILGYTEHLLEVFIELQNAFKEENQISQSYFLNIIALCARNVKIDLKEEIEKAPAGKYRDALLKLTINADIADNISSDIFYETIVRNMNSQTTYTIAQNCISILAERNYEKTNSLLKAFEKSNIQAKERGKKKLIYPLRRSAKLARRILEFSAAKNPDDAVKKFLKSLNLKLYGDSEDILMLYRCLRFIKKNNMTNLLPTLKKMKKSIWISQILKDNIISHSC